MPEIDPVRGHRVGDIAFDFTLEDLDGKSYRLEEMRGKRVVQVVFWATWCVPCIEEFPILRAAYKKYRDEGLMVLGVVVPLSQTPGKARAMAEKFEINYPILWDADGATMDRYGISSIPRNFLIDKAGVIRQAGTTLPPSYEHWIEKLLQEPGGQEPPPQATVR